MFYHLRVSVLGAQMLDLIGELHIDLRSLIQKGRLPELGEWHNLRSDGRTTGVIQIALAYLDADQNHQQQAEAPKATARWRQQQQRWRKDERQTRIEEVDFPVW